MPFVIITVNYTVTCDTIAKKRRLILNTFAESGVINAVLRKCLNYISARDSRNSELKISLKNAALLLTMHSLP